MQKHFRIYLLLLMLTGITACRKEKAFFEKVIRIESNTSARLNRIQFVDGNTAFIAGGERFYSAQMLISDNAGASWKLDSMPEAGKGMYGLAYSPAGIIYMSGYDGKLIYSADKGQSWQFKQLPNWTFHVGIACPTADKLILIGYEGNVVTLDTSYNITDTKHYDANLNDICMVTDKTGYIAAYGGVLKTTDGGDTWNFQSAVNDNFTAVYCLTENELWLCGYQGTIYHSSDGGANWHKLRNGNALVQKRYRFLDIIFRDTQSGWAVGEDGLVVYTKDGGNTWAEYRQFTKSALRSITFAPDGNLMTVGDDGSIYKLYIH